MAVMLTEKAANEIKRVIAESKYPDQTVLRVGLRGGGCSGFEYSLGLDPEYDSKADEQAKDIVSEQHGLRIAVDKKSDLYLDGTTVDFRDEINRRGFAFDNPNAVKTCGCGSSFQA